MRLLIAGLTVALLTAAARAESGADRVKVDLIADTTAVQPSQPFTVGIHFRIDPGWHIYWVNAGDSGLPTRVAVHAPAGYTVGRPEFPTPQVLHLPGDIVNYGYEDDVTLLVRIVPPANATGAAALSADATWLVCQDKCLPGNGTATLTLPIGPAHPAHADEFAAARALMPCPTVDGQPPIAESHTSVTGPPAGPAAVTIDVVWAQPPTAVEWAPFPLDGVDVSAIRVKSDGKRSRITFTVTARPASATADGFGVLVIGTAGHRVGRTFALNIGGGPTTSP